MPGLLPAGCVDEEDEEGGERVGGGRPAAFPSLRGYYFGCGALPVLWQVLATVGGEVGTSTKCRH